MSGGMNKAFKKDPLKFLKTYPVAPPDDIAMYHGDVRADMPTGFTVEDYSFSRVRSSRKIAYLNFMKVPAMATANTTFMPMSENAMTFDGSFVQRSSRHVPAYFLPWSAGGAIIRLTIPRVGDIAPGQADSPYFFTATITGCSVFIKGTPDRPTIYHAGGETNQDNPVEAARFWRDLMTTYSTRHGAVVAEVNKTDYIRSPGAAGGRATQHALMFEAFLQNERRTDLDVQFVEPWGSVSGLRDDAGNWTFYLQENATVFFYKMRRTRDGNVRVGNVRSMARPIGVREIFPNASPTLMNITPMPRIT